MQIWHGHDLTKINEVWRIVTNRKTELQCEIINHRVWRRYGSRPRVTIQDNAWLRLTTRENALLRAAELSYGCLYVTTIGEKQHMPWNWIRLSRISNTSQAWPVLIKREKMWESILKHQKDWYRRQTGQNGEFRIMRDNAWEGVIMFDKSWSGVKIESIYELHSRSIIIWQRSLR
jgi:hypothetical protein